jgi:ATP-dependent Zn protease
MSTGFKSANPQSAPRQNTSSSSSSVTPTNDNSNNCNNDNSFDFLLGILPNNQDVKDAKTLFDNAKFYYVAGQLSGALVSFSCASVLLNSIIKNNQTSITDSNLNNANNLLQCCLQAVNVLQPQVGSSSKAKNDDEENQDWAKICTKIKPLVFSKGSSDCLFFSGVAGLNKEKKLFKTSLIFPLTYPNLYPKAAKGILLYGPPGTGKTYIVKAAVNELQKSDPTVGVVFFSPSPGDLKGKYVGETEKRIEEIFTCASMAACESELGCPEKKKYQAIIFMDEFDAIGPDRSDDPTGLAANSVNTLLQMMDGIKSKQNVAVIAATNYPWKLDSAILRRFTTQILIDLPNSSDIKQLLNIEVKKMVEFKAEKKFSWCESQQQIAEKESATGPSCNFECEEKIPIDLSMIPPYNSVDIDYYSDKEYIDGLINFMATNNFSNSDVARFMLAAQTNSGELAVKGNIFYKASLLQDFTHDLYISSLTKPKNSSLAIQNAIKLLKAFASNSVSQTEFFQVQPPDILRIEYNDYYYYNVKSLLYKDNTLIVDHPSIKDIYIKVHEKTTTIENLNEQMYKKNVLGLENDKPSFTVDIIITFDFYIKETNTGTAQQILLPLSHELINKVFKPVYNNAKTIYDKIQNLNKIQPEKSQSTALGDGWFKNTYGQQAVPPTDDIFFNIPTTTTTSGFFTDFIQQIQQEYIPLISKSTIKDFSLKYTNFDFYNYLILYNCLNPNVLPTNNLFDTQFLKKYTESLSFTDKIYLFEADQVLQKFTFEPFELLLNDSIKSTGQVPTTQVPTTQVPTTTQHSTIELLYDKDTTSCLMKISDYITLIKNYAIYQKAFNDAIKPTQNSNNDYISIDVNIFKILFKNTFDNSKMLMVLTRIVGKTQLFPEMDGTTFNIPEQRLIQLFINDILDFKNLSDMVYKDDQKKQTETITYIEKMFQNLNETKGEMYDLLQLICLRVYNNSNFVQSQSKEIEGGSNNTQIHLSDIPDNYSLKMGGKKKFKLTKNKLKREIKSSRKNKIMNMNKTKRLNKNQTLENKYKIIIDNQSGGALNYEQFIKFINKSENVKNDSIVNKSIFVATKYDYSEVSKNFLRKTSVINSMFYSVYDLFGDKNNKTPEKIISQIQKKNQYLPLIFKKIEAIGFLSEEGQGTVQTTAPPGTQPTGTQPTGIQPTVQQQPKTIDDKDIKKPEIIWSKISESLFGSFGSYLQPLTGTSSKSNFKNSIVFILEAIIVASGLLYGGGPFSLPQLSLDTVSLVIESISGIETNFSASLIQSRASIMLFIFMLCNLYTLSTSQKVSKETILNDFTLITIFNLITEIQQVETDDFDKEPVDIFLDAINKSKDSISWWQSFVKSTTTESSSYVSSSNSKGEIKKYESNMKIDPEIKKKLTNLNVPIQSFSYALTLVKTTYDKETGRQLKLYDTDREELLKELRKKK